MWVFFHMVEKSPQMFLHFSGSFMRAPHLFVLVRGGSVYFMWGAMSAPAVTVEPIDVGVVFKDIRYQADRQRIAIFPLDSREI